VVDADSREHRMTFKVSQRVGAEKAQKK
jgi:hypothetical protein